MSKALAIVKTGALAPFDLAKPPKLPPVLNGLPALADPKTFVELTQQMLGNGNSEFDLKRYRVGRGGSTNWVFHEFGEELSTKELNGVILASGHRRAFYANPFGKGGSDGAPPDCASPDASSGFGVLPEEALKNFVGGAVKASDGDKAHGGKGFDCANCPFAQWGSAVNEDGTPGAGQRCKQVRAVYFLGEGDNVPSVIVLPSASLAEARKFFNSFLQNGLPPYAVRTKITLAKSDKGGFPHARAQFGLAGKDLKSSTIEKGTPWYNFLAQVSEFVMLSMLPHFTVQRDDVSAGE